MQKFKHHCIIDEISYNKQELIDLFNRIPKECELPWNQYKKAIKNEGGAKSYTRNQNRGDGGLNGIFTPYWEGKQLTEYPEIQNVLNRFNFVNEKQGTRFVKRVARNVSSGRTTRRDGNAAVLLRSLWWERQTLDPHRFHRRARRTHVRPKYAYLIFFYRFPLFLPSNHHHQIVQYRQRGRVV